MKTSMVKTRTSGDTTIIEVGPSLASVSGSEMLDDAVRLMLESGERRIVFDLAGAVRLGKSGVGQLISIYVSVARRGGCMRLLHASARTRAVLDRMQLCGIFRVYEDEDSAVQSCRSLRDEHPV